MLAQKVDKTLFVGTAAVFFIVITVIASSFRSPGSGRAQSGLTGKQSSQRKTPAFTSTIARPR